MGSSPDSRLTALQRDLLREIFARDQRFFLTGGAALADLYLHHRETDDLDLFSNDPLDLDLAARTTTDAVAACVATVERLHASKDFVRLLVRRGMERCVVDLVVDRAPALDREKTVVGAIRFDTLRDITANKLTALFGRSEIRDLVDLMYLLGDEAELGGALVDAEAKDAGFSPAELAWVLSEIRIPADARLPAGVAPSRLDEFRLRLISKLEHAAFERARTK